MSNSNDPGHQTLEDPLLEEGQFSGKLYWLNVPGGYELDFDQLRDSLQNRSFHREVELDVSSLHIPEVFQKGDGLTKSINIGDVSLTHADFGEIIVGPVVLDEPYTVRYRGDEIVILGTSDAMFLLFQYESHYYLEFMSSREVAEDLATLLAEEFDELGSAICETKLSQQSIEEIRESLDAELMDTEIADYPQPELTSIRMRGRGFQEVDEYERQITRGEIRNHMMRTESWIPGSEKVIGISRDGLVRSYSKISLSQYFDLLTTYVLPRIFRDQNASLLDTDSASLSVWQDGSVFQQSNREEDECEE